MIDASKKSVAMLIDEAITNGIRCWMSQEKVMAGGTDAEVAEAARVAQKTNARRNQLMRAIDEYFHDPNILAAKSYDPDANAERNGMSREELLVAHLTGLAWNVVHPTDTSVTRGLAQAALEYLEAIEDEA